MKDNTMRSLSRFGVSLDRALLQALDRWLRRKGFANRSQALGELIREALVREEWQEARGTVIGTVTLVYDPGHHVLSHTLTRTQHRHHGHILSSQHIHLDEHNCLEVIVLKGRAGELKRIADRLRALKGIKHGQLIMTTAGRGPG
jgi:CopG family nickel-responsive transcriptional regulator